MQPYEQLETEWAEFNGLDPAGMVACSSGTAALHLALEAAGLRPGAEVLCADFNMIAVPRAVALAGLAPVFVDCGPDLCWDPELALRAEAFGDRTSGAVATHVYGRRARGLEELGERVLVVEDLAEAHGVRPAPASAAACWSFYRNKIVAGEEGGAVWFRDPARAEKARRLRSLGFTAAHDYAHEPRGHNYRLANCLAEKVLDSLRLYVRGQIMSGQTITVRGEEGPVVSGECRAVTPLEGRRALEAAYNRECPIGWWQPPRDAPWVYDLRVPGLTPPGLTRAVTALKEAGIAARHAFKPMSRQEEFRRCRRVGPVRESEADRAAREVLYLPLDPTLPETVAGRAFRVLRRALGGG